MNYNASKNMRTISSSLSCLNSATIRHAQSTIEYIVIYKSVKLRDKSSVHELKQAGTKAQSEVIRIKSAIIRLVAD